MAAKSAAPAACLRPHDLLWLDDASALIALDALPAWATPAWLASAPVVVRRAPRRPDDRVPVGLRGATRSERCAAHAVASRASRTVTPEEIAARASTLSRARADDALLPCLLTLARLAPSLDDLGLAWGVTGSVGFTLASSFDVLRAGSDLDLLVRTTDRNDARALRAIAAILRAAECRVDVQVETVHGAFALGEWLRTGGPVLLKTAHGPRLCDDPWEPDVAPVEAPAAVSA